MVFIHYYLTLLRLKLSYTFDCDKIYDNHFYELGHTLLCCLSQT